MPPYIPDSTVIVTSSCTSSSARIGPTTSFGIPVPTFNTSSLVSSINALRPISFRTFIGNTSEFSTGTLIFPQYAGSYAKLCVCLWSSSGLSHITTASIKIPGTVTFLQWILPAATLYFACAITFPPNFLQANTADRTSNCIASSSVDRFPFSST